MRLFESIIDANHRAVAGDTNAGLHPADFADALPVIALTCIDPRLNAFFPNALALPAEEFIWLRNAGNIITGPLSSTMRSLALACAVKGGRGIAIIGHSDCQVAKTTTMLLLDKLKALGVDRSRLPENIADFFGTFGSERQNVIKACDFVRHSPLIGPKIPVHGLLLDIETGKLDWVVNGYETLQSPAQPTMAKMDFAALGATDSFKDFDLGEMKFPEMKIGEAAAKIGNQAYTQAVRLQAAVQDEMQKIAPVAESVGSTVKSVADYAEQHWPKPPTSPPPLKKVPLPPLKNAPPLNPRKDFRRG
ncbi:MAG TPA: carbonic anhydrase [Verrucomicrobiae bacterium]